MLVPAETVVEVSGCGVKLPVGGVGAIGIGTGATPLIVIGMRIFFPGNIPAEVRSILVFALGMMLYVPVVAQVGMEMDAFHVPC